jgi:hypothetical protein
MKTALPLCLLLACGAMWSEVALAAHHHRPNAAAARSGKATGDAKSPVSPEAPADAWPAGSKSGDAAAPIDTSISVNQGHRLLTRKEAAAKKLTAELGKLIPRQAKPHSPAHPFTAHVAPPHNAVGAAVEHDKAAGKNMHPEPGGAPPPSATIHGTTTTKTDPAKSQERTTTALKVVAATGQGISGTGTMRPAAGPAALGGLALAKFAAGGLNGGSFRPKH